MCAPPHCDLRCRNHCSVTQAGCSLRPTSDRARDPRAHQVFRPAGGRRPRPHRPRRRVLRAARPERRRQDHDAAHGRRAAAARRRLDPDLRHRRARRSGRGQADHGLGLRRADDLRQAHAVRISRIRRRPLGHRAGAGRSARARTDRLARPRRRTRTSAARASPRACGRRWRSPARWCTTRG